MYKNMSTGEVIDDKVYRKRKDKHNWQRMHGTSMIVNDRWKGLEIHNYEGDQ
jgi:hypothetical protein